MGIDDQATASVPGRRRLLWIPALALVIGAALALRLWNIDSGLPLHLVNADEDTVLGRAFAIASGPDPDPHWFLYPTFFMYLVDIVWGAMSLAWRPDGFASAFSTGAFVADSGPYFLSARVVVALFGAAGVGIAFLVGRELGGKGRNVWVGLCAAAVTAVDATMVAYSHAAVTDVPMVTLLALSLWLCLRAARLGPGGGRSLALAALAGGVATSTKYSAGLVIVPLFVAALVVFGRRWRPLAAGVGLFACAFVVASPFTLLNLPTFVGDFVRQNRINAGGWLGFENVGNGWWYNVDANLGHSLGLPLLLLAVAGIVAVAWRRDRAGLILLAFAAPYFALAGSWDANFDRYMLPLVPILGALAGYAAWLAVRAVPAGRSRGLAGLGAVALVGAALAVPASRSISDDRRLGLPDTRALALALFEREIPPGSKVATDTIAAPLADERDAMHFARAGVDRPGYRLLRLPTPNPGGNAKPRPSLADLRREGYEWIVTSSAIRDRVMAAAARYPREAAFYRQLGRLQPVETVRPAAGTKGPTVTLYRVG